MSKSKLAIIGAGGLTGRELLRLLSGHDGFEVVHVTSNQVNGKSLREVFPSEPGMPDLSFVKHDSEIPSGTTVVLATPNEASMEMAPKLLAKGHKVIDLSGAYRLHDESIFEKAYKFKHLHFDKMKDVVFGIPELFREKIKNANFVSNPGCFSTSAILPIALLGDLRKQISSPIIIDSKSGVSGAGGRTEEIGFAYTHVYENFRSYKVLSHQHEPEIAEYAFVGSESKDIVFTPHLLPVYRGILSTIYIQLSDGIGEDTVREKFSNHIKNEPFIRLLPTPEDVEIRKVQNSNFLDIGFRMRKNHLVIVSALDNLGKGAAGQALQNLNLMHGFAETKGLLAG
ncbi:N-acetyl-gamma-glutamyl-phosphate reductase [Leptospira kobayashii]|uniref:N-acetyl-gamma-glutamyl-phosphate reductase n=1 Tax=Leptospira kobayashii TaxID=1917830 RepID=A0ABN6KFF7_9LEPT|nr:N-acetyl-gamma-glutamyl-phosphate reductase [Leptospira kobayashii]BDA78509.1 N-acetyl-gamma-glutamyl-phosphate reductase [Leptospira kobayashii]